MREQVWRDGEDAALADYLERGYRLLARNWSCRIGELDLVFERDGVLVVCEVKARRGSVLGGPHESVTPAKQRKLRALTQVYLATTRARPRGIRFDVASVTGTRIHVFEDAF